jgi:hypothetical protein
LVAAIILGGFAVPKGTVPRSSHDRYAVHTERNGIVSELSC